MSNHCFKYLTCFKCNKKLSQDDFLRLLKCLISTHSHKRTACTLTNCLKRFYDNWVLDSIYCLWCWPCINESSLCMRPSIDNWSVVQYLRNILMIPVEMGLCALWKPAYRFHNKRIYSRIYTHTCVYVFVDVSFILCGLSLKIAIA